MTAQAAATVSTPPVPIPIEHLEGYWRREASHFPQPLTPFTSSFFLPISNGAFRRIMAETGALLDGIEFREIGGWVYNRQVPMGGKDRKAPPPWLMWALLHVSPTLRSRVRENVLAVREGRAYRELESWHGRDRTRQQREIERLRAMDLESLDDAAFASAFEDIRAFTASSAELHFRLVTPGVALAELVFDCEELLGWDEAKALSLLRGLSVMSTEPARRLAALARMAAERPAIRAYLEQHLDNDVERLPGVDSEFAAAFSRYQAEFGFRALRYELADPTLIEVPSVTLALIRDQLLRKYDPDAEAVVAEKGREAALAEARAALASHSATERERFECDLERARAYYPTREDNEFFTVSAPLALLRFAAIEAGRRLQARGIIEAPDDVFFLEIEELRALLSGDELTVLPIAARKGMRQWALAHPGPASYGRDPGPPPSFGPFPEETRRTMRAMFWFAERVFAEDASARRQQNATALKGIPASPGTYTGPVRIVMGEDEFGKLRAGDVLVCPITSPVWSVLFPSVGALVTDSGGILSHPAIISREYGIPAVVATGNATALLQDGQRVTVDGATGTIVVVE